MSFDDEIDSALKVVNQTFGKDVTYTRASDSFTYADPIQGVFDNAFYEANNNVSTTAPVLRVRLADFPVAPAVDDTLTVSSIGYKVIDIHLDAFGGATLILHET